jgi:hypothetical protein
MTINIEECDCGQLAAVSDMRLVEEIVARGHPNVLGTHRMTFEITKDRDLSKRGDCVIGVGANKGPNEFSSEFKEACRREGARVAVRLEASRIVEVIHGLGNQHLTFTHPKEMVGRKSSFTSDRTIMIRADKAACDLNRELVEALRSPNTRLTVRILVEV